MNDTTSPESFPPLYLSALLNAFESIEHNLSIATGMTAGNSAKLKVPWFCGE